MHKQLKQNNGVAFVKKLFKIVRSKQNAKSICWDHKNLGVKILNENLLVEKVLVRYFKLKSFTSFVRQLNIYGFHKVKINETEYIFTHDKFNPYDEECLLQIKRKVSFKLQAEKAQLQTSVCRRNKQNDKINFIQEQQEISVSHSYRNHKFSKQVHLPQKNLQKNQQPQSSSRRIFSEKSSAGSNLSNEQISNLEIAFGKLINKLSKIPEEIRASKLKEWRINSAFRNFLMNKNFYQKILQEMKLPTQQQNEQVKSCLSIDGFCTKRSLEPFRFLQSGPLQFGGTVIQPTFEQCMINSLQENSTKMLKR